MNNRIRHRTLLQIIIGSLLVLILIMYVFYQSRSYLQGPVLAIRSPAPKTSVTTEVVLVEGVAENISYLWLNDRQIYTNPEGRFKEVVALPPGYTIIEVTAEDKFNRSITHEIEVYRQAPEPTVEEIQSLYVATTTSSSTNETIEHGEEEENNQDNGREQEAGE